MARNRFGQNSLRYTKRGTLRKSAQKKTSGSPRKSASKASGSSSGAS